MGSFADRQTISFFRLVRPAHVLISRSQSAISRVACGFLFYSYLKLLGCRIVIAGSVVYQTQTGVAGCSVIVGGHRLAAVCGRQFNPVAIFRLLIMPPISLTQAGIGQRIVGVAFQGVPKRADHLLSVIRPLVFLQITASLQVIIVGLRVVCAMRIHCQALLRLELDRETIQHPPDHLVLNAKRVGSLGCDPIRAQNPVGRGVYQEAVNSNVVP